MKCSLRAIIWYIYSGEINFIPRGPPGCPSASGKSIYRFADEVRIAPKYPRFLSKGMVAQDGRSKKTGVKGYRVFHRSAEIITAV